MDYESLDGEKPYSPAERTTGAVKKWVDGAFTRNRAVLLLLALGSAILTIRGIQVHEGALHDLLHASHAKTTVPADIPKPSFVELTQETHGNASVTGVITPDQAAADAHYLTKGAAEVTGGIFGLAGTGIAAITTGIREFLGKRKKTQS